MRFQIKHQNIIGKSKERERLYEQMAENDEMCKITSNLRWTKRWASGKNGEKARKINYLH